MRLFALYANEAGYPIDQRPVLTWSSSDSTVVRILSDSLAEVLDTGAVTLSAVTRSGPPFELVVPLTTVPRFTGRLIWVHQPAVGAQLPDVMVQDFPVGAPRRLHSFGHATESKAQPTLTSDGRLAVVVSSLPNSYSGALRLYVVDIEADTSRMLFPTSTAANLFWPVWMPGDSTLAFLLGVHSLSGGEVYTARLDGSNLQRRTNAQQGSPPVFDISPDGNVVIVLSRHFVPDEGNNGDIYEITLTGDTVRRVTNTTTYEGWPSVSPDGTMIAYTRGEQVWLMNRDGSQPRPLVPPLNTVNCVYTFWCVSAVGARSPTWSPDGKYVVIQSYASFSIYQNENGDYYGHPPQIYAIRVADGLAIRLTYTSTAEVQPDMR